MSKRDYYEVLELARTATDQEIKSAYRRLAVKHHPDKNPGDNEAEDMFKEAAEAYSVLSDAEQRRRYDRFGHQGVASSAGASWGAPGFGGIEDILGDLFGFGDVFGGSRSSNARRSTAQRGADLRYDLEIEFEEAAAGIEKVIKFQRLTQCEACNGTRARGGTSGARQCPNCRGTGQVRTQQGFFSISTTCGQCRGEGMIISDPCPKCQGQGRIRKHESLSVKIPAGVDNGSRLKLRSEGEAGYGGGPQGDLYVVIHVKEHAMFVRQDNDVIIEVPISFPQAAVGTEIEVPTLEGKVKLKIPSGTQSGKILRLKGKGIVDLHGYGRGDQLIKVNVETPRSLTARQRELLEEFAKLDGKAVNHPLSKGFVDKLKEMFG